MRLFPKSQSTRSSAPPPDRLRFAWPTAPSPDAPSGRVPLRSEPADRPRPELRRPADEPVPSPTALPSNVPEPYWRSMFV
jgi:hypothetical protein